MKLQFLLSDLAQVEQREMIGYSLVVVPTEVIEKAILKEVIIAQLLHF